METILRRTRDPVANGTRRRWRIARWLLGAGCLATAGLLLEDVGARSRHTLAASVLGALTSSPAKWMID